DEIDSVEDVGPHRLTRLIRALYRQKLLSHDWLRNGAIEVLDVCAGRDQFASAGQHPRPGDATGVDRVAQRNITVEAGVTEVAYGCETTREVFARQLSAGQHPCARRHRDREQQPREEHAVAAAVDFGFRGHHDIE